MSHRDSIIIFVKQISMTVEVSLKIIEISLPLNKFWQKMRNLSFLMELKYRGKGTPNRILG